MESIYTVFKCIGCSKENILLTEEVKNTLKNGNYISCSHCGCKKLRKESITNDLRECMKADSYFRNKRGAIEQRR